MSQNRKKKKVRIASVSLNQTVYDWAHNVQNIKIAIDKAVADGADILATEELSLVGYPADDYHQWNKTNDLTWRALSYIASYAKLQNPNLVLAIGVPWHHSNKSKLASDPEYNINNRPFNSYAYITGGEVIAISAKTILADGAAEYEPRQFSSWPLSAGSVLITLPDGSNIPFGKPIVSLKDGDDNITLFSEICADAWPGINDDFSVNKKEQYDVRHIVSLAQTNDLSVVLNPSASKPEPNIDKEKLRMEGLCLSGSFYANVYVYTNYLGSASGTYAADGSQIFAQNNKIVHRGQRYSFQDVSYSSISLDVPVAQKGNANAVVSHIFNSDKSYKLVGGLAPFDKSEYLSKEEHVYEEYIRSIALWLRDYSVKQNYKSQGYVVSLSGGKDSAYGAFAVSLMIDLEIKENGIEGFFDRFKNLKYQDDILALYKEKGLKIATRALKKNFLTCVYIPTDNSSNETFNSAKYLANGIGCKFIVSPVQPVVDELTASFVGINLDKIASENFNEILEKTTTKGLNKKEKINLARGYLMQRIKDYVNEGVKLPEIIINSQTEILPSWTKNADDITLQNIQARARLPIPWTIANHECKIPLATSNESEAVHSYTTAGGDMHMGGANPIGGVPKHIITKSLAYFEEKGLIDLEPVEALHFINQQQPTAELRKIIDGKTQTDEDDLGFTYEQSKFLEELLIVKRKTPEEVLEHMKENNLFDDNLIRSREIILIFAHRWEAGQFKRIMAPLSPHVGSNVDPHQAVRTTVLGDHFKTGCAYMTISVLKSEIGEDKFEQKFGMSIEQAKSASLLNSDFKEALSTLSIETLLNKKTWERFTKENNEIINFVKPKRPLNINNKTFKVEIKR